MQQKRLEQAPALVPGLGGELPLATERDVRCGSLLHGLAQVESLPPLQVSEVFFSQKDVASCQKLFLQQFR